MKGKTLKKILLALLFCLPTSTLFSDHRADGLVVFGTATALIGIERLSKLPQDPQAIFPQDIPRTSGYLLLVAAGIITIIKSSEIIQRLG